MKVEAPKLQAAVEAHRKARGGDKSLYAERVSDARKNWRRDKQRLRRDITHYRAKLDEACAAYAQAKSEADTKISLWERKLVEATEQADASLPRFTDAIKVLAYTSSLEGASDSTIRIALGCATLREARAIIQEGKDLAEEEQW